jgi:hypothetical protein
VYCTHFFAAILPCSHALSGKEPGSLPADNGMKASVGNYRGHCEANGLIWAGTDVASEVLQKILSLIYEMQE